jgi:hypothetical protein
MKIDEKLSDVFDVEPMEIDVSTGEIITANNEVIPPQAEKVEYDYDQTRSNLYSLLNQGQDALMAALSVAKQSEHPRAFEVVGNLMSQLADINEKLMKLHEKKQKLDAPAKKEEQSKQVTNNNAIFVGSTTELNKMLQNMTKGN